MEVVFADGQVGKAVPLQLCRASKNTAVKSGRVIGGHWSEGKKRTEGRTDNDFSA